MTIDTSNVPSDDDSDDQRATSEQPAAQWATACHEAGHAVVALSLGRTVQRVTIVPGKTDVGLATLGRCHLGKGRASKDALEDETIILLAGMVSEARVTGRYCAESAQQDLRAVRRLVESRFEQMSQIERHEKRMLDKTEHLVDELWNEITAVAKELIARQTIRSRGLIHLCRAIL